MKPRSILTIGLLAVIALVGCAPAAPAPAQSETPPQPAAPVAESPLVPSALPTTTLPAAVATEAPAEITQPVATSRGPELHATNPAEVRLASGELQLVEFFRFT